MWEKSNNDSEIGLFTFYREGAEAIPSIKSLEFAKSPLRYPMRLKTDPIEPRFSSLKNPILTKLSKNTNLKNRRSLDPKEYELYFIEAKTKKEPFVKQTLNDNETTKNRNQLVKVLESLVLEDSHLLNHETILQHNFLSQKSKLTINKCQTPQFESENCRKGYNKLNKINLPEIKNQSLRYFEQSHNPETKDTFESPKIKDRQLLYTNSNNILNRNSLGAPQKFSKILQKAIFKHIKNQIFS